MTDAEEVVQPFQLTEVELLTPNPDRFTSPFNWRIRLQMLKEMPLPIDIGFMWLGSKSTDEHDIVMDEIEVGPLTSGIHEFTHEHDAPDHRLIPQGNLINVTGLFLTFSYAGQQFLRVGYYVSVAFWEDRLNHDIPPVIDIAQVGRHVLLQKPLMNCYGIDWSRREAPRDVDSDDADGNSS